jgi:Uma2 family endonuclease
MATAIQAPEDPAIEYPDDDGNPMSENTLQNDWMMTLKGGLIKLFRDDPNVFTACDLLWYPVLGEPTIRTAPDAMVAFGRPKGRRGSYKQWEETNQPPHVVFEVLAPGNRPGEMDRKLRFYDKYGVEEYYVYDPDDGSLEGWLRSGDHLLPIAQMAGHVSPRLGILFDPGEGPDNLKIYHPDGSPFVTWEEQCEQVDALEQQADKERRRADEERLRAERLAARLRELGIEPD